MKHYVCTVCGYVYDPAEGDPDNGVAAGTAWEDVPEDWVCPLCGVGKDSFEEEACAFLRQGPVRRESLSGCPFSYGSWKYAR